MKKHYTTLLAVLGFALGVNAQAPDFTLNDLNGNSHTLSTQLNAGKIVLIDIYAVWCGPCWDFHNEHTLEQIYTERGPAGTGQIEAYTIEGDGANAAAVQGSGGGTLGDWTSGATYTALLNGGSVADAYNIVGFPTLYVICADGSYSEPSYPYTKSGIESKIDACPTTGGGGSGGGGATAVAPTVKLEASVDVYPNPTAEKLYIKASEASTVVITDIEGRVVFQNNKQASQLSVDVSAFTPGNYIVVVTSKLGVVSNNVVIK